MYGDLIIGKIIVCDESYKRPLAERLEPGGRHVARPPLHHDASNSRSPFCGTAMMKPNIRILVVYGVLVVVLLVVTVFETHKERLYDNSASNPVAFKAPRVWSYLTSGYGIDDDIRSGDNAAVGIKKNKGGKITKNHSGGDYNIKYDYNKNPDEIISDFTDIGNDGNILDNSIDYLRGDVYLRKSGDSSNRQARLYEGGNDGSDSGRNAVESSGRNSSSPKRTPNATLPVYVEFMPPEFRKPEEGLDMYHPPLKKILVWVEGYGSKTMSFGYGRAPFVRAGCKVDTCLLTAKRSLVPFQEFDALIFHFRAMVPNELPKHKYSHQHWVFWEMESASYVYQDLGRYNGLFNLTMTYRRDSDIHSAYGKVYPVPPMATSPSPAGSRNYAEGKSKMAAWFVSNCHTHSRREKLVAAMQKFIQVDIIGHCGSFICSRNDTHHCYTLMARHYKFYLSFENSLCKDYITEKLFSILRYDVVPVVLGLADYTQVTPPNSYINALDYPSVEHLIRHLQHLDANDTAYNQYFKWKGHYRIDSGWSNTARGFCDLCQRLHQKPQKPQVYRDLKDWFIGKGGCKKLDIKAWTKELW